MDPSQFLLQQAAEALEYGDRAREDLLRTWKDYEASGSAQSTYNQLVDVSHAYGLKLSFSIPITQLYAAQYSEQKHRYPHVASLLEECYHAHHKVQDKLAKCEDPGRRRGAESAKCHFQHAGKMIDLARRTLLVLAAPTKTGPAATKVNSDDKLASSRAQADKYIPPLEYFKPTSLYGMPQVAQDLLQKLTDDELGAVVIEKLYQKFECSSISTPSLGGIYISTHPVERSKMDFNALNAVISSPMAVRSLPDITTAIYQEMVRAITKNIELGYASHMCLAKAMRNWKITLGFIFSGDSSVIVWPTGGGSTSDTCRVVIYSRPQQRGFSYSTVKLLKPTVKLLKTSLKSSSKSDEPGVNVALSQRQKPKTSTLLQLPAELRNKIYAYYLEPDNDRKRRWSLRSTTLHDNTLPELSRTCRQLRDELLPMMITTTSLTIVMTKSRFSRVDTPSSLVRSHVLTKRNCALAKLPALSHFQDIEFVLPEPNTCRFKLWKKGETFFSEFTRPQSGNLQISVHPKLTARFKELNRLVTRIVNDRRTEGLGFYDIAAIAEFLFKYCDPKPQS